MVKEEIISGIRDNTSLKNKTFNKAYFHLQEEIEAEFVESDLGVENSFGVGLAWTPPDLEQMLTDQHKKERLLQTMALIEKHPMQGAKIMTVGIRS